MHLRVKHCKTTTERNKIENNSSQILNEPAEFNLQMVFALPYTPEIKHYKDVNTYLIKRVVTNCNWKRAFIEKLQLIP